MNWMRKKVQKRIVMGMLSVSMIATSFNIVLANNNDKFDAKEESQLQEARLESNYTPPVVEPQVITIEDSSAIYTDKEESVESVLMSRDQSIETGDSLFFTSEIKERFVQAGVSGIELDDLMETAGKLQEEPEVVLELLALNGNDLDQTRKALVQKNQYVLPDAIQERYAQELARMIEANVGDKARQQLVLLMELRPDLIFDNLLINVQEQGQTWIEEELDKVQQEFATDLEQLAKYELTEEDVVGISSFNLHMMISLAEKSDVSLSELLNTFKQSSESTGMSQ